MGLIFCNFLYLVKQKKPHGMCFNPLQWGLFFVTLSTPRPIMVHNRFQSPSMGLIFCNESTSQCVTLNQAVGFNPLQWGLFFVTTPPTPTQTVKEMCFNPLQWGLFFVTPGIAWFVFTFVLLVSIPFNGAYFL